MTSPDGCPSVAVVSCAAEIDLTNAGQLHEALLTACRTSAVVVVDMSGTVFCDASGVRELVHAHERAMAGGGELRVVIATPALMRTLAVLGMDRLLRTFASLPEALRAAAESAARREVCHATSLSV